MADFIPEYDELKIRIRPDPDRDNWYSVLATGPDNNPVAGRFRIPFTENDLQLFVLQMTPSRRGVRGFTSSRMEEAKKFGVRLYEALLTGELRDLYDSAGGNANANHRGLRVTLSLAAPDLMQIPWEFLYDPADRRFLAQSLYSPLVRTLDVKRERPPWPVELPLQVLAMASGPDGYEDVRADEERTRLEEALEPLSREGTVKLNWLERATLEDLDRRISAPDEIHILHYIGHGAYDTPRQEGILVFEDARGRPREVSGEELCTVLRDERSLQLVVLNSCEGARSSQADPFSGVATSLLHAQVPAVIGMQLEISNEAAITFAKRLYTALGHGYAVDAAVADTRKGMFAAGHDTEFGTPVLFLRSGDARLFDIRREGRPVDAEPRTAESSHPGTGRALRVEASGHADHTTIGAALAAAKPGTEIVVTPGTYSEDLTVTTPRLTIRGDGDGVVIAAPAGKSAMTIASTGTHVENLTLRVSGIGKDEDEDGLDLQVGTATLETCSIIGGGVAVGPETWLRLRNSRVYRSTGDGINFQTNSGGEVASCEVSRSATAGVSILAGSDPILRDNEIHDGGDVGILIVEGGRGTIETNDIFNNAKGGIGIEGDGDPLVWSNKVHHNGDEGIVLYKNGRATIDANEVFNNVVAGIAIMEGSDCIVRGNNVHHGKGTGILVVESGRGTIESNEIVSNGLGGIRVEGGGSPSVRNNRIYENGDDGVCFDERGCGLLEDNEVFANKHAGVSIRGGSDPVLRGSKLHHNEHSGIYVVDRDTRGKIESNEIFANAWNGIAITNEADPKVASNRIHENGNAGVRITGDGLGTVEGNEVFANEGCGVEVDNGDPTVRMNKLHDNLQEGIVIRKGGRGTFEKNTLFGNRHRAILNEGTAPVLKDNDIRETRGSTLRTLRGILGGD